jgi:hypothetical protein
MRDVSDAEITYQPSFTAEVLSAAHLLPPMPQAQGLLLSLDVPAFGMRMDGEITDLRINNGYREVTFESFVYSGVAAQLTLRNEYANGTTGVLQIKGASLNFRAGDHKPRTHFVADSLYALLGLAGQVRISIPDMNIDLGLNFKIRPSEISKFLELRQIEFGLMVIEKATGLQFAVPQHISGDEIKSIGVAYHAILTHQFVSRVNEITQPTPANEERLAWFDNLKSAEPNGCYKLMFGPSIATRTIFGREVPLGDETVLIDDAIIEDRDKVRRELAQKDGHIVPIRIRPRSRKARYAFANTPQLPDVPWDEKIENFISLEDSLNERLAARYHELAASTVADLTPEEIEAVTARPELGEDAHLVGD